VSGDFLKVHEVSDRLALSEKTVYRMIGAGSLPAQYFGRAVRVPAKVIHQLVDEAMNGNDQSDEEEASDERAG